MDILYLGYFQFFPYEKVDYKFNFDFDVEKVMVNPELIIEVRSTKINGKDRYSLKFPNECTWYN